MHQIDKEDRQIISKMAQLPSVKTSSMFKSKVKKRIYDLGAKRTSSTLWQKYRPWVFAVFAHAAVLFLIANIYLHFDSSSNQISLRKILYNQRSEAINKADITAVDDFGFVVLSGVRAGSVLRLVPLKECIGVFTYNQWQSLASVTRSAYESELGFEEVEVAKNKAILLNKFQTKNYFKYNKNVTLLKFVDRLEIWNTQTLSSYLDEYPVDIKQASLFN